MVFPFCLDDVCVVLGGPQGEFVIAGCAEGELHVWKWDSGMEISRISAHRSRIHHCSVLPDPGTASLLNN